MRRRRKISRQEGITSTQKDASVAEKLTSYQHLIRQLKKDLNYSRERTIFFDYSLDGTGFYLKKYKTYVKADGTADSESPSINVSDGKIMGYFYLSQSQAVIQPATERPQVGTPEWTDTAYLFNSRSIPEFMNFYPNLSIKDEGKDLIITGEKERSPKENVQSELRIDKATFTPKSLVCLNYYTSGALKAKTTKTWQYQNVAGLLLPKIVTEQEYRGVLNEAPELETERTLTITHFDPIPINAKAEFAKLMNSNWNVFDEISGTHYMTGNPGEALDKLSK